MAATIRTFLDLYTIYKNETQARQPNLTDFTDGSINDIIDGACSTICQEIIRILLDKFKSTYLSTAEGSNLDYLVVDHFGQKFERPQAQKAVGIVKFYRPNTSAGDIYIDAGTIVKTDLDANGNVQRFQTVLGITMTGLEINASVISITAGEAGNVEDNTVINVETALLDPTIEVLNESAMSGGDEIYSDAEYREYVGNLIDGLKGATLIAIESAAASVSGVEKATAKEFLKTVIEWNSALEEPIGDPFNIPITKVYIADANGVANSALLANVDEAITAVRAAGVKIEASSGEAYEVDWTANLTLNPAGPNYAVLQSDTSMIVTSMTQYIQDLAIGADFNRISARAEMLLIWGSGGTDDLTDFTNVFPAGNISANDNTKMIPGTIGTV